MPNRTRFKRILDGIPFIRWLLRDDFTTPYAATISGSRTSDIGTLEIVDTEGLDKIDGGYYQYHKYTTSQNYFYQNNAYTRVIGRTLATRLNLTTSGQWAVGFNDTVPIIFGSGNLQFRCQGVSTSLRCITDTGYNTNQTDVWPTTNAYATMYIIARSVGGFFLFDDGSGPKLTFVGDAGSAANMKPYFLNFSSAASSGAGNIDYFKVMDLPAPFDSDYGIANSRVSGAVSNGYTFTHENDFLMEYKLTTLPNAGQYIDVVFRKQDANNKMYLRIDNAGSLDLRRTLAGVDTSLTSFAGPIGANHKIQAMAYGGFTRVFSFGSFRFNFATTDFPAATAGEVSIGTGGAISDLVIWPRTISGSALAALSNPSTVHFNDTFDTPRIPFKLSGRAEPGPGTRNVLDTQSFMSTTGTELSINGTATANLGIDYGLFSRTPGRMMFAKLNAYTSGTTRIGFGTVDRTGSDLYPGIDHSSATVVRIKDGTAIPYSYTIGSVPHHVCSLMRSTGGFLFLKGATGSWKMMWMTPTSSAGLYPKLHGPLGTSYNKNFDFIRIPDELWLPSPLASDSFNRGDYLSNRGLFESGAISIGSDSSLDDLHSGEFTIDGWFRNGKLSTGSGTESIVYNTGYGTGYMIYVNGAGNLSFTVAAAGGSGAINHTTPMNDSAWHHFCAYYNNSGDRKCYLAVDGVWQTGSATSGLIVSDASNTKKMFQRSDTAAWQAHGDISWIRISNNDRYSHGTGFAMPLRTVTPVVDANTIEMWSGINGSGTNVPALVKPSTNNGAFSGGAGYGKDTLGFTDGLAHLEANGGSGLAWTGSNWSIKGNKAINTPTNGTEILPDPGLEATYTAGLCNSLTTSGAPTVAQSADVHGGSKAQSLTPNTVGDAVIYNLSSLVTTGKWYMFTAWLKRTVAGTGSAMYLVVNGIVPNTGFVGNVNNTTSYTKKGGALLITNSAIADFRLIEQGTPSVVATELIDDMSVKELLIADLISSVVNNSPNVISSVDITIPDFQTDLVCPSGLVLCLDSTVTPANFVLATIVRLANGTSQVVLYKCVGGTYTAIISTSVTYVAGATLRVIKDGNSVSVFYNGAQVGTTQTVSDAGIVNNTNHGLFSTYIGNTMDSFNVWAVGSENQYSVLDRYIQP